MTSEEKQLIVKARRAYHKEWRQKNREKVREYQNRYWTKKAREMEQEGKHEQPKES